MKNYLKSRIKEIIQRIYNLFMYIKLLHIHNFCVLFKIINFCFYFQCILYQIKIYAFRHKHKYIKQQLKNCVSVMLDFSIVKKCIYNIHILNAMFIHKINEINVISSFKYLKYMK